MGITPSSHPRMDQFLSERVGYPWQEPLKKLVLEVWKKEADALFGDSETEYEARYSEFMKGGPCKESFMALDECSKVAGICSEKCKEPMMMLLECMDSHPAYYQPVLAVMQTMVDRLFKELRGLDAMKQTLKDDALAARNQAFWDNKFRRFR